MYLYFLIIRIAALFGHKKARLLVRGQGATLSAISKVSPESAISGAIWFHAASVGEFEQARPLIERLRLEQPKRKIILTFFSPSGYELRKNYDKVDGVYYLPFATRRNARKFIDALQPSMAIFVKYEFWPAYILELKKRDIPVYSISAIFRPKQIFFRWWGKRHLRLLKSFTKIFVQDEESRRLLEAHGVQNGSIAGDTRFDRVKQVQSAKEQSAKELIPVAQFVQNCERVIVAGSTWPEDEKLLAKYVQQLSTINCQLSTKLILVPHEINEEHLHFIFNLFQGRFVRYSAISAMTDEHSRYTILQNAQILLIDSLGLLSSIYAFGQVAYIGGGFGVGIHNTIEAAVYGIPVVFGPHYEHFREAQGLIDAGAARSIKKYSELEAALNTALDNHESIGVKAAEYVQSELGATDKIYKEIFKS